MQERKSSLTVRSTTKELGCDLLVNRKLTKRLEELTQGSSALKAHLAPQLKALSNMVSDLVNFGIQVCPHVARWHNLTGRFSEVGATTNATPIRCSRVEISVPTGEGSLVC